jgi:hypothetical protein
VQRSSVFKPNPFFFTRNDGVVQMTKLTYQIATVFALLALVVFVQAEDKEKSSDAAKDTSTCCAAAESEATGCAATGCGDGKACPATSAAHEDKKCPIALAMERLPKISFAVGDQKTCCPKAAGELAEKSGAKIQYLVADKTFAKESDAKLALVEATEEYVSAFAKPKKCSVSGSITVAGEKLDCEIRAAQTAKIVQTAIENVKFTYLVGNKECHCPIEAKQVAKETGKETLYAVGDEKTCCSVTARLNLARAKYKAAVEALVQADAKAKDQTAGAGS